MCKEHPRHLSPDFGFDGDWRFLTGVWHPDIDLDMVTGLWYTYIPNFGPLSWFWRCKEHLCALSPDSGLWLGMKVPDWGLASWYWFGYGHWSLIYQCSKFWIFIFIWRRKEHPWPFSPDLGLWMMLKVPDWGLIFWSSIWIWSLVFGTPIIWILALHLDFESAMNIHVL